MSDCSTLPRQTGRARGEASCFGKASVRSRSTAGGGAKEARPVGGTVFVSSEISHFNSSPRRTLARLARPALSSDYELIKGVGERAERYVFNPPSKDTLERAQRGSAASSPRGQTS